MFTSVVIDKDVDGSIMPSKASDFKQAVVLKGKFHVKGSIYAKKIDVLSPGCVEGDMMSSSDITFSIEDYSKNDDFIRWKGDICAGNFIFIKNTFKPKGNFKQKEYTCLPQYQYVINGSLIARKIRIENAIIAGNVFADEVFIKNSIVLGVVEGEQRLDIEDSMLSSVIGGDYTVFSGNNTLFLPTATFAGTMNNKGKIRYIMACATHRKECSNYLLCPKFVNNACSNIECFVHEGDLIKDQATEKTEFLTLLPRMYNMNSDDILHFSQVMQKIISFNKTIPDDQQQLVTWFNSLLAEEEKSLFATIVGIELENVRNLNIIIQEINNNIEMILNVGKLKESKKNKIKASDKTRKINLKDINQQQGD